MVNQAPHQTPGRRDASLVRFLPSQLGARLASVAETPAEEWFEGACVCADVVGFTELTERLAESGEHGLERLADLLSASFSGYVREVRRSGGEVLDFAGDALVAYWTAAGPNGLALSARAAATCAARMALEQERAGRSHALPELHTGVGAGKLWAARVGGSDSGLHLLLGGKAVRDAFHAQKLSERGEVLVAPDALSLLGSDIALESRGEHALVARAPDDLADSLAPRFADVPLTAWPMGMIPRVVQERWAGQHSGFLSELRRVTPIFVRIEGLDDTASDSLSALQAVSSAIHEIVSAFSLERGHFMLDDKGLLFLLVFGVPYNTHADDVPRAMRAALAIERRLAEMGFGCAAGLASGPAYCGVLGGEDRAGYATIGPPMNRAARLMAEASRGLLCQASLGELLDQRDIVLSDVGPLRLKGLDGLRALRVSSHAMTGEASADLAGREKEQARIDALLDELVGGRGAVLTIVGEAGLGKTALVADLADRAHRRGLTSTWARADPEESVSYGAWRQILAALLEIPAGLDPSELERTLSSRLERLSKPEEAASLLGWLLGGSDERASGARSSWRADATLELMTEIVRELVPAQSVLILEDAHWMDSASFRLAERVAKLLPGLLLVLTTRTRDVPAFGRVETAAPRSHEMVLGALDEEVSVALAQKLLGGRAPEGNVLALVRHQSGGNPLYIVECLLLESVGTRQPSNRAPESGPHLSMRALITSRLDRLPPNDAAAVRAASVLGNSFTWSQVERLSKAASESAEPVSASGLVRQRILVPVDGAEGAFRFSHAVFRDVAYELMLVQQRRALHVDAARLLEAERPRVAAATLAHHFELAGDDARTLVWSDRAGTEALELGAFEEATRHFERCLSSDAGSRAASLVERLRWHRKLSDAYAGLGSLGARAEHARQGLTLADEKPRQSRTTTTAVAASEFVASALRPRHASESGLEIAALYRHLAHVAYFESDGPGLFVHTLRAVRAAEAHEPSSVLCGAMAELGGAIGLGGVHALGARYLERAVATAERLEHPHGLAYVHLVRSLYMVGRGAWGETRESAEKCQEICDRIVDPVNWGNAQIVRFWLAYYRGESAVAESVSASLLSRARRTGNRQHETWALRGLGLLRLRQGLASAALPMLEAALGSARERDVNEYMPTQAAVALCHLKLGNADQAVTLASSALALAKSLGRPTGHAILSGLVAVAEVMHEASRETPLGGERCARALERLDTYRKVFPIGTSAYFHYAGKSAELAGRERAAREHQRKSAVAAARFDMPSFEPRR